jgi:hypothetical protein
MTTPLTTTNVPIRVTVNSGPSFHPPCLLLGPVSCLQQVGPVSLSTRSPAGAARGAAVREPWQAPKVRNYWLDAIGITCLA